MPRIFLFPMRASISSWAPRRASFSQDMRIRQRSVPRADTWRHDRHRRQCRARRRHRSGAHGRRIAPFASLFNAFKKLSDPSHVRCLGLLEWHTLLANAGFTVTHAESLDKEIEFGTWVRRMRL